ncbi:MAG TPA: hypothetical protein VN901_25410, partial [Candidatus Acidoferrales bacterium]|nr:hypothetical protein [Candidatus Acidoferrales bacterium]
LAEEHALQVGAAAFFQKPADNDELMNAIRACLPGSRTVPRALVGFSRSRAPRRSTTLLVPQLKMQNRPGLAELEARASSFFLGALDFSLSGNSERASLLSERALELRSCFSWLRGSHQRLLPEVFSKSRVEKLYRRSVGMHLVKVLNYLNIQNSTETSQKP